MTGDYDNPNSESHLDTTDDTSFVLSVHDNQLLGYMVDGPARRITLRTVYDFPDREPEYTNVVFEGVFAYHFAGDTLNTILFDIEETTLEAVWDGFEAVFTKYKNYGWPPISYTDRGAADVESTPDDLRAIETAASQITVEGNRYPEHLEQMTGR